MCSLHLLSSVVMQDLSLFCVQSFDHFSALPSVLVQQNIAKAAYGSSSSASLKRSPSLPLLRVIFLP